MSLHQFLVADRRVNAARNNAVDLFDLGPPDPHRHLGGPGPSLQRGCASTAMEPLLIIQVGVGGLVRRHLPRESLILRLKKACHACYRVDGVEFVAVVCRALVSKRAVY